MLIIMHIIIVPVIAYCSHNNADVDEDGDVNEHDFFFLLRGGGGHGKQCYCSIVMVRRWWY